MRGPDGTSILWQGAGTSTAYLVLMSQPKVVAPSVVSEAILFEQGLAGGQRSLRRLAARSWPVVVLNLQPAVESAAGDCF